MLMMLKLGYRLAMSVLVTGLLTSCLAGSRVGAVVT